MQVIVNIGKLEYLGYDSGWGVTGEKAWGLSEAEKVLNIYPVICLT